MDRGFQFTLSDPNRAFNLWDELIQLDSNVDKTNATKPFVPNPVCDLQIMITDVDVINAGHNMFVYDAKTNEILQIVACPGQFVKSTARNSIDCRNYKVRVDAAGGIIHVSLTAR